MYAVWASQHQRVIFIHGSKADGFIITYGNNCMFLVSNIIRHTETVRVWVQYNLRSTDLVIIDDTNPELIESICLECTITHAKLIICTSYQALKILSYSQDSNPASWFMMESWRYEEYVDATNKGVFPFSTDKLDEHYYYAGGSVRYMFWSIEAIITFFSIQIRQLINPQALLHGWVGDYSMSSVNSLIAIYKSQYSSDIESIVISEYVTRALRLRVDELEVFLETARAIDRYNSSWLRWVSVLDVSSRVRLLHIGSGLLMWSISGHERRYAVHYPLFEIPDTGVIPPLLLRPCTFYTPKLYNPHFHLAHLDDSSRLSVFQVTENRINDSCNLKVIYDFACQVGAIHIEYIIVCRKCMMTAVPCPSADQMLPEWGRLMSELYTNKTDMPTLTIDKLVYDEKIKPPPPSTSSGV